MTTLLLILAAWVTLSFPLAVVVGRAIKWGQS